MNKKSFILMYAASFVVALVIIAVVIKKQGYEELPENTEVREDILSEDIYVPSYKDKLSNSILKPTIGDDIPAVDDSNPLVVDKEIQNSTVESKENPVSSFETVKFSSVMTGRGIKAASDEEIANAGHYHIGDTVLDNAKYVLFHDSKYYDLVYTEVEWDGYTLQDVTLGKAHDTLEEAFKRAGVTPKGIPMYLPLNLGGIKTMAEFNEIADDVVLIVFDGAVYTKIPYSQLVQ